MVHTVMCSLQVLDTSCDFIHIVAHGCLVCLIQGNISQDVSFFSMDVYGLSLEYQIFLISIRWMFCCHVAKKNHFQSTNKIMTAL